MKGWLDKLNFTAYTVHTTLRLKFLPVLTIYFYLFE
jgi:hypothetical protein